MKQLLFLTGRNLALFRKNKLNILLSFASIGVVLGIYILFLRDFMLDCVLQAGIAQGIHREFTDRMMVSGLLVVVNTTTCFGAVQTPVCDKAGGNRRDYLTAPVPRFSLTAGYWLSTIAITFFFSAMTLLGSEAFFRAEYGSALAPATLLQSLLTLLVSSAVNSGLLLCLSHGIKSTAAFSTFANLYGTLIGFLSGVYLPYSFYPGWLKKILFFFPPTQTASLTRRLHLDRTATACGLSTDALDAVYEQFGISAQYGGTVLSLRQQTLFLLGTVVVLLVILVVLSLEKKKKTR